MADLATAIQDETAPAALQVFETYWAGRLDGERRVPGFGMAAVDGTVYRPHLSFEIQEAGVAERSSMLHVRMDSELKRRATEALAAMGLTASEAVRLLFHRIAVDQAFPLELKVPNAETRAAMAEADEIVKAGRARFATVEEMLADLEETGRP